MFSRRERLPRASFASLKGARRRSTPYMTALLPSSGAGYAVIISKKTVPTSVARHRLKRRVFGALRQTKNLSLPPALVLYPKASAATLSAPELRATLTALLEK